jgi:pentatricopeptide repeat domain-containing protein 1
LVAKFLSYRKAPNAEAADKVLRLYNSAGFDPKQWTGLLNELARKKQATWAMLVLNWMSRNGAEPNIFHYTCVISSCEKARQWEKALALLQEVKKRKGIEPDEYTYSAAISACEKGGQWEQALALLEEVKERQGIEPNEYTYSAVISACEKGGQWEQALALLAEVKGRQGIEPNEYTYSAAISACEKGGQWEQALTLLEEVKKRQGIEPDVITYNAAISACEKGGQWGQALALLAEVKEREGIEPDVRTYSAAISACEKGGQWEQALALLEEVKERQGIEPDEYTYNATLDAVSGQLLLARTLYLEAVNLKIYQPPNDRTAQLWKFDLHDHSEGAAITAARWWIETEVIPWHFGEDASPDVSLELITGYGKTRQVWRKGELSGGDIKVAVMELLVDMEVPIDETDQNPGRLAIDRSRWRPQEEPTSSTE